jgi:hypothetical protein
MALYFDAEADNSENDAEDTPSDLDVSEEEEQQIGQDLMELILGPSVEKTQQQPAAQPQQLRYGGRRAVMPVEQRRMQRMERQQQSRIPAGQANAMKNFLDQRVQRYSLQNRATRQPKAAPIPMPTMQNRQMRSNMPVMQPQRMQQMPNPLRQQPMARPLPMQPQAQPQLMPQQSQMYQPLGAPFQAQQSPMFAFNPYQQYS